MHSENAPPVSSGANLAFWISVFRQSDLTKSSRTFSSATSPWDQSVSNTNEPKVNYYWIFREMAPNTAQKTKRVLNLARVKSLMQHFILSVGVREKLCRKIENYLICQYITVWNNAHMSISFICVYLYKTFIIIDLFT